MKRALRALCAPADLLGVLFVVLVAWPVLGGRLARADGCLWLEFTRGAKWWRYSTTIGHTILLHPDHGLVTRAHELRHVRQFEGDCVAAWLVVAIGAAGSFWSPYLGAFAVLVLKHWATYAGHSAAAWAHGERAYRDNVYERLARYETEGEA